MERHGDNRKRMGVPQFGAWDQNDGAIQNYSVVFSQARADRKQAKNDIKLGNEANLVANRKQPDQNDFKLGNEADFQQPKFKFPTDQENLQPKSEFKLGNEVDLQTNKNEFKVDNEAGFNADLNQPNHEFKVGNGAKNEVKIDNEANFTSQQPHQYYVPNYGYHQYYGQQPHQYYQQQYPHYGYYQHYHQDVGTTPGWRLVPEFGEWDQKGGTSPSYPVVYGQGRQDRKQAKKDAHYANLPNEANFTTHQTHDHVPRYHYRRQRYHYQHRHDDVSKRKFTDYLKCFMRPQ